MIGKIISGGQTGVDRAALDVAVELGIPTGGWMPADFLAEDGYHPSFAEKYGLRQMDTTSYQARTRTNIEVSDQTLILVDSDKDMKGGTLLTMKLADQLEKPRMVVWMKDDEEMRGIEGIRFWLSLCGKDGIINVAGPRESKRPGIYERAAAFLRLVLEER